MGRNRNREVFFLLFFLKEGKGLHYGSSCGCRACVFGTSSPSSSMCTVCTSVRLLLCWPCVFVGERPGLGSDPRFDARDDDVSSV